MLNRASEAEVFSGKYLKKTIKSLKNTEITIQRFPNVVPRNFKCIKMEMLLLKIVELKIYILVKRRSNLILVGNNCAILFTV